MFIYGSVLWFVLVLLGWYRLLLWCGLLAGFSVRVCFGFGF